MMKRSSMIGLLTALLYVLSGHQVLAATSTEIVSVTSTTTVHATATDYSGACDNFVGACVVYGTDGSAPYTTTVYQWAPSQSPSPPAPPPPPTVVTSTRTYVATTTVSDSGACSGFSGACVVYNTDGGPASSTVYYAGSSASPRPGNSGGYIGPKNGDGSDDGAIGGAAGINRWTWITVLGSAVICAMLLL